MKYSKYIFVLLCFFSLLGISWVTYNKTPKLSSSLQFDESLDSIPAKPELMFNQKKAGDTEHQKFKDINPKLENMKLRNKSMLPTKNIIKKTEKSTPHLIKETSPKPTMTKNEKNIEALKSKIEFYKGQKPTEEIKNQILKLEKQLDEIEGN